MAISKDGGAIATASVGSEGAIGTIAGTGRYGCRSRVICCRISIPPCIRPKKQRTFGSQVPTAASGKNRNSLNIRRADRPYPCGFCGGSRPQRAFHPRYGRCALYRVTLGLFAHLVGGGK